MPTALCPLYTPPVYCDPFAPTPEPGLPAPTCVPRPTDGGPIRTLKPTPKPKATPRP